MRKEKDYSALSNPCTGIKRKLMIKFNDLNKLYVNDCSPLWAYNLFWWKVEGGEPLNGLNVYRPSDPHSAGFAIKFGRFKFRVRYSKRTKKWFWGTK
jgi:hypothetical protein